METEINNRVTVVNISDKIPDAINPDAGTEERKSVDLVREQMIRKISEVLKRKYGAWMPDDNYHLKMTDDKEVDLLMGAIFTANTKATVSRFKEISLSRKVVFKKEGSPDEIECILAKSDFKGHTKEYMKNNLLMGDFQLAGTTYLNNVVVDYYKKYNKFIMTPQARASFSDSCIYKLAQHRTMSNEEYIDPTEVVKCLNLGSIKKTFRATELKCYSKEQIMAQLYYSLSLAPESKRKETLKVVKETMKKVMSAPPQVNFDVNEFETCYAIMVENGNFDSAQVDELILSASEYIESRGKKDVKIYGDNISLVGGATLVASDKTYLDVNSTVSDKVFRVLSNTSHTVNDKNAAMNANFYVKWAQQRLDKLYVNYDSGYNGGDTSYKGDSGWAKQDEEVKYESFEGEEIPKPAVPLNAMDPSVVRLLDSSSLDDDYVVSSESTD